MNELAPNSTASSHQPVLLREAIEALAVKPGGHYVDCTLGRGGHASGILEQGGSVLALDADPSAIAAVRLPIQAVRATFDQLESIVKEYHFVPTDGILFDLGVSSAQLEDPSRGFSFGKSGPLDMRFDPTRGQTAADIVNNSSVEQLVRIFSDFGEEPHARQFARAIELHRRRGPIRSTDQLAKLIEQLAGGRRRIHPATRVFQALRIAVNRELEQLQSALEQAVRVLATGGRLVVISFHSLEDRIVKTFIARESRDCLCPPSTPVCTCGHKASLESLLRKPIRPSEAEIARNPRSRSAKMRVAAKL